MSEHCDLQRCARFREEIAASLPALSLDPSPPSLPPSLLPLPPPLSSLLSFLLSPSPTLQHAPSPSSQPQYRQLELNLIPLQFKEKVPVGCCLGSALTRRVNSAVVLSPFASGRVWVRALPPPFGLPRLKGTEWQVGSSGSQAGAGNPQVCPKWRLLLEARWLALGSSLSLTLLMRRRP
ncbi:hypothetical protein MC885_014625 [Smutsia gigantea]|nr:hypothetical protein MC885_014625 [Smutsia gigantea]